MLSDISIYRDFPVVNGFVQVPPNFEKNKTKLSLNRAVASFQDVVETTLSLGSGRNTGSKFGAQRWLRLRPLQPGQSYLTQYGSDPQADMNL